MSGPNTPRPDASMPALAMVGPEVLVEDGDEEDKEQEEEH